MTAKITEIGVGSVRIRDSFWSKYQALVREKALPYQWEALNDRVPGAEPSHAIKNLRIAAGREEGEFYGFVFQDSDLGKWLETLSYSLMAHPDPGLEGEADEVIDLLESAQAPDGYLNSYFTVKEPGKRFTNLQEAHELYCAGHLIEAAVAYFRATGKRKLLSIACRFADLIDRSLGPEPEKLRGYCGHPEIELALVKLFEATGEERYLALSRYFIDERGREPYYFDLEREKRGGSHVLPEFSMFDRKYLQAQVPVRKQETAEGHAVRVTYLYSAVADVARLTGDKELRAVAERIWDNITTKRMYVTGGIGSTSHGEAFTCDYDLPNDSMYAETCASVGMALFAHRMLMFEADRRYADVLELELYNGALSGISLDGMRYFYVNPLEVWPAACVGNPALRHVKPERQPWYACACCPPNISRLILSLGQYIYTVAGDCVDIHLYVGNEARIALGGGELILTQRTDYPYEGRVVIAVGIDKPRAFALKLRIPGWCGKYSCAVNGEALPETDLGKGYLRIERTWSEGDRVELDLDMPVTLLRSNPKVRDNGGRTAIKRGPLVYCIEEIDNGKNLHAISIASDPQWHTSRDAELLGGTVAIQGRAFRSDDASWDDRQLYAAREIGEIPIELRAIPYSLWCNRSPGEMAVWIRNRRSYEGDPRP